MAHEDQSKKRSCCAAEHERLKAALSLCDELFKLPADWHRCARVLAKRSGRRAKQCMLTE